MKSVGSWRRVAGRGVGLLAAGLIAACGGGGGGGGGDNEDLSVDFSYDSGTPIVVWHEVAMTPLITGLEGNTPQCRLVGGALPPGLVVNRNCTISGTTSDTGVFEATVRLTVEGYSGHVDTDLRLSSLEPQLRYPQIDELQTPMAWGEPVSYLPQFGNGTSIPREGDTYAFSLEGTLPEGLVFDTQTGTISGRPVVADSAGYFRVAATITREGRTRFFLSDVYTPLVAAPPYHVSYPYPAPLQVGGSITVTPDLFGIPEEATLAFSVADNGEGSAVVPQGLALDPHTGVVSGIAAVPWEGRIGINVSVTRAGLTYTLARSVYIQVQASN